MGCDEDTLFDFGLNFINIQNGFGYEEIDQAIISLLLLKRNKN